MEKPLFLVGNFIGPSCETEVLKCFLVRYKEKFSETGMETRFLTSPPESVVGIVMSGTAGWTTFVGGSSLPTEYRESCSGDDISFAKALLQYQCLIFI